MKNLTTLFLLLTTFFASAQNQESKTIENTYPQKYTQSGFSVLHNFLDYEPSYALGFSHLRMKKWSKNYGMGLGLHLFPLETNLSELAFFTTFVNRIGSDVNKKTNYYVEINPTVVLNPDFYFKPSMYYYPGLWLGAGFKTSINEHFAIGAQANGIILCDIDDAYIYTQSIFQISIFFKK